MATTRLGLIAVGVSAYRGLAAQRAIQVTRLTVCGIGGARYLPFLPKTAAAPQPEVPGIIIGGAPRRFPYTRDGQANGAVIVLNVELIVGWATASSNTHKQSVEVDWRCICGVVAGNAVAESTRQMFGVSMHAGSANGEISTTEVELLILAEAA